MGHKKDEVEQTNREKDRRAAEIPNFENSNEPGANHTEGHSTALRGVEEALEREGMDSDRFDLDEDDEYSVDIDYSQVDELLREGKRQLEGNIDNGFVYEEGRQVEELADDLVSRVAETRGSEPATEDYEQAEDIIETLTHEDNSGVQGAYMEILDLYVDGFEGTQNELSEEVGITQSTVSEKVQEMEDAGLLEKEGRQYRATDLGFEVDRQVDLFYGEQE